VLNLLARELPIPHLGVEQRGLGGSQVNRELDLGARMRLQLRSVPKVARSMSRHFSATFTVFTMFTVTEHYDNSVHESRPLSHDKEPGRIRGERDPCRPGLGKRGKRGPFLWLGLPLPRFRVKSREEPQHGGLSTPLVKALALHQNGGKGIITGDRPRTLVGGCHAPRRQYTRPAWI